MPFFTILTQPSIEPDTLAELKAQARVDANTEDTLLQGLVVAARQWAERYTGRAFITQSWRLAFDRPPEKRFVLVPRPPLLAVTQVQSYDDNNNATLWNASNYYVDTLPEPGRLVLRQGGAWPDPGRFVNGLQIDYTAGYGPSANFVPEPIKLAIKQLATHWYAHRGEAVVVGAQAVAKHVPLLIQALLDPYRVQSWRI